MRHFSDTYGKRPIGLHGVELPRFSDNLKEYWKASTPSKSSQNSVKKFLIINKHNEKDSAAEQDTSRTENISEFSRAFGRSPQKINRKSVESNIKPKPTQIEHLEAPPSREHNKNARWTNYHYNFIHKPGMNSVEKTESKSITPEYSQKSRDSKDSKASKSLIATRMANRGNYSPGKDQFRSTGFT